MPGMMRAMTKWILFTMLAVGCGKAPTPAATSAEYEKPVIELRLPTVLAAGEPFDITVTTQNRGCGPERVERLVQETTPQSIVVRAYYVEYKTTQLPPCKVYNEKNTVRVGALAAGDYTVVANPDATDGSRIALTLQVR